MFCPNISDPNTLRQFNKLVKICGGKPLSIAEFKSKELRSKRQGIDAEAQDLTYKYWDITEGIVPQNITKQDIEKTIVEDSLKEENISTMKSLESTSINNFISIDEIIYSIPEIKVKFTDDLPNNIGGKFILEKFHKTGVIKLNKKFANDDSILTEAKAHELIHGLLYLKYKESHKNIDDYSILEWSDDTYSSGLEFKQVKKFDSIKEAKNHISNLIDLYGEPPYKLIKFQESNLKKDLDSIWKQIRNNENISDSMRQYIDGNIQELVTYTLTNLEFAKTLNNIIYNGDIVKYKSKSIFSIIMDLFLKLLPQKGSAYEKILSILEEYGENIRNLKRTPSNIKYIFQEELKYSLDDLSSFSIDEDVMTIDFEKVNNQWKYKVTAYKGENFEEKVKEWANIESTDPILLESLKDYNRILKFKKNKPLKSLSENNLKESISSISLESKIESSDVELNNYLETYLKNLGFNVKVLETLKDRLGVDANGATDFLNKTILIAKNKENKTTLPEEFGHVVIEGVKNESLFENLMSLVKEHPLYQEVKEEYGDSYKNDEYKLAKETAGKLMGSAIIKEWEDLNATGFQKLYKHLLTLWNRFIGKFKKVPSDAQKELQDKINSITSELAKDVFKGTEILSQEKLDNATDTFYQKESKEDKSNYEKEVDKVTDILQKTLRVLNKRASIFKGQGKTPREKETKLVEELRNKLRGAETVDGVNKFIDYIEEEIKDINKKIESFNKVLQNPKEVDYRNLATNLRNMKLYVSAYNPIISEVLDNIDEFEKELKTKLPEFRDKLFKLQGELLQIDKAYYKLGIPTFVKALEPFFSNSGLTTEKLTEMIKTMEKDISFTQRWFDSMAENSSDVLKLIDILVKNEKENVRKEVTSVKNRLIRSWVKAKKAGVKSQEVIYERLEDDKLSGYVKDTYKLGQWHNNREKYSKSIQTQLNLPEDSTLRHGFLEGRNSKYAEKWFAELNKLNLDKKTKDSIYSAKNKLGYNEEFFAFIAKTVNDRYKAKWRNWFMKNSMVHPDWESIIAKRKEELTEDEYIAWEKENYPMSDNGYRYHAGELSIPSDGKPKEFYGSIIETVDYTNYKYNKLSKAEIEFINEVKSIMDDLTKLLPRKFRDKNLLPQIRKDFIERMKSGVSWDKLKEEWKESVKIVEDESEYGDLKDLTDLEGNKVNFIPILFNNKLSDMDNLSTDIVETLTRYADMAHNYNRMNKIVDVVELGQTILDKTVLGEEQETSFVQQTTDGLKKLIGKEVVKKGTPKQTVDRLKDYIDATIYGQVKKPDAKPGEISKSKIVDKFNRYVSLNGFALNLFAGIANKTFGEIQMFIEGASKEFYSIKDREKGRITYNKYLKGKMEQIGSIYKDNFMDLWEDKFNSLIDYEQRIREINSDSNSRFARLMRNSPLYFMTYMGEHTLQMQNSFALAHSIKVKDNKGKEHSFIDAWTTKDNELVLKPEFKETVTEEDIKAFERQQNFINKRLNGIYNTVDKAAFQRMALGRLASMYRKFIKPGWNKRFAKQSYNFEAQRETEGFYETSFNFFKTLIKERKSMEFSVKAHWNELQDYQKANIIRMSVENLMLLGLIAMVNLLEGDDDDKETMWFYDMFLYQATRQITELSFFNPVGVWGEGLKLIQSPFAGISQLERITTLANDALPWNWLDEIESGKYKGWLKWQRDILYVTPLAKTIYDWAEPKEKTKFYNK